MKKRNNLMKNKLFEIIMISTIASILMSALVSFISISSVEKRQTQSSMQFSLNQLVSCFDQSYLNMVNIMQNLEPGGKVGIAVNDFLEEQDNYEKAMKKQNVDEMLSNILFTNLNVRKISYVDHESNLILFSTGASYGETMTQKKMRILKQVGDHFFSSLEKSSQEESEYLVSMIKEEQKFGEQVLDIYVELKTGNAGKMEYKLLQIDEEMTICYTESEDFKAGEMIEKQWEQTISEESFNEKENHLLISKSKMGFYYALAMPLSEYNKETNMWQLRMAIIMAISFLIFYSVVVIIYRMIVQPIQKLKTEIAETGKGNFETIREKTGIEEFDQVIATINHMKEDIKQLQEKEKRDEERHKKVEIEKLMYQINPHFVLNTLYSVQWMAQKEGNTEIREFVHNLIAILAYNLGKEKTTSSLRTEIEIAKKYIEIQRQRYDFDMAMQVEEGAYLDQPTIRMLLQPLIENALQYGLGKSGRLELWIFEDTSSNYAVIIVRDYGEGLTKEKLWEFNQPLGLEERTQKKSGIGLRYVRSMLETFYGGKAILNVNSMLGKGTKITILIPLERKSCEGHEKLTERRRKF